jgi:hypothetical protein
MKDLKRYVGPLYTVLLPVTELYGVHFNLRCCLFGIYKTHYHVISGAREYKIGEM